MALLTHLHHSAAEGATAADVADNEAFPEVRWVLRV